MKLIDLKRPKKTKAEMKDETVGLIPSTEEQDRYPYGACLRFDKEEIEKISSLEKITADQEVEITAQGFVKVVEVTDASSKAEYPRSRKNVEIQITKIAIEPKTKKDLAQMNNEEYRAARESKQK